MIIYCDTHVHCYQIADLPVLLTSAASNMQTAAEAEAENNHQSDSDIYFVLFFTNSVQDKSWPVIQKLATEKDNIDGWQFNNLDSNLVQAVKNDQQLILAPARQLVSKEKLEFLLLGCDEQLADGQPAQDIINTHHQKYCVICPWGVGKWLGQRSNVLDELINKHPDKFVLGDNGGRGSLWKKISHFKSGLSILNGSDPLPIDNEIKRVGDFGIKMTLLEAEPNLKNLIQALKDNQIEKMNYGSVLPNFQFIKTQLALRKK